MTYIKHILRFVAFIICITMVTRGGGIWPVFGMLGVLYLFAWYWHYMIMFEAFYYEMYPSKKKKQPKQ